MIAPVHRDITSPPSIPADATDEAIATVSADEFMAPPTIPHYETGPITTRAIERNGMLWSVTYHAEYDGVGWLVKRCECHPAEAPGHNYLPGEVVPVMLKIVEDAGPRVKFLSEGPGETMTFWGWRSQIVPGARPGS